MQMSWRKPSDIFEEAWKRPEFYVKNKRFFFKNAAC